MNTKTIGINILIATVLFFSYSRAFSMDYAKRSISSTSYSIHQVEIMNSSDNQKFNKIVLDGVEKIFLVKKLLELNLKNEEYLKKELGLSKDYFKSIQLAVIHTDKLLSSSGGLESIITNPSYGILVDILNALRNNFQNPFGSKIEILTIPFLVAQYTYRPEINVPTSLKFSPPELTALSEIDFKTHIAREKIIDTKELICTYAGPKSGYGFKPGFKAYCNDKKVKIKFGNEVLSGPFNSRIFGSLGYVTPKIDKISDFKMKYDRRLFTEFNSQKEIKMDLKLAGIKVKTIEIKKQNRNSVSYIKSVVLNDSNVLSPQDFYNRLVVNNQYDEKFETEIAYIVFSDATVTEKLDVIEVGPWGFDEIRHQANPKIREGVILSAWLGNTDIHMGNNKLIINKDGSVLPIFLDVGYGLGKTDSALGSSSSDIKNMNWDISDLIKPSNESSESEKVVVSGFISQQYNALLSQLNFEDVYRALVNICKLDQKQLQHAFIESGSNNAEADLGTQKLLHRRSKLIHDFGIQKEFKSCYQPQKRIY